MHVNVPHTSLRPETLTALIEEFVTREGAVHGHAEALLESSIESVRRLLASGKAVIVFDDETESCTIRLVEDMRRDQRHHATRQTERRIEPVDE